MSDHAHRFDRFEVIASSRLLLRDGDPVDIGGRTFDLLLVLLRARGQVIGRTAIMQQVWPHAIVEDNNLRVQVAALRRALGPSGGLIKTVSGKGYMFAAEARRAG